MTHSSWVNIQGGWYHTPEQARALSSLLAIDSALELAGMDRAWLHSRSSRLRRRTPLKWIQAGTIDDVLRALKKALAASVGYSTV